MKFGRVSGARIAWADYLPALLLLAALPVCLALLPITHDAIWQIWLGRRMLHGATLYRDLIEVNPPLWFWSAVPLAALGEALGLSARVVIVLFFFAAIGLSLFLSPARYRLALLAVLVVLPLHDFGQREHFALIASAPYVFAVAARSRGETPRYPVLVGLFAALGLCLKPYFLLVPVALLWMTGRKLHRETVALGAFAVAYVVSVPLLAPSFITAVLPLVQRFYGAFGKPQFFLAVLAIAFVLAAAGAWLGRRKGSPEGWALLTASLAFVPAVLIQAKGFPYHSIPMRGFLCLAILIELQERRSGPLADGLLIGAAIFCCLPLGVQENDFRAEMERHLAGVHRGTSIIALSPTPSVAWPIVEERGLDWKLRSFSVWSAFAAYQNPRLLPEARRIIAPDLASRPDILVIDRRPVYRAAVLALVPPGYLDCYRLILRTAQLESYRRRC